MADRGPIDSDVPSQNMFGLRIVRLAEYLVDEDVAASGHREYPQKYAQYESDRQDVGRSVCFGHLNKDYILICGLQHTN